MPATPPTLSPELQQECADRYAAGGVTQAVLAVDFCVSQKMIQKICKKLGAVKPPEVKQEVGAPFSDFVSAVKSKLWAQDPGKKDEDHTTYNTFVARCRDLVANCDHNKNQAIVAAAKEQKSVASLFQKYDVSAHDKDPESHQHIQKYGDPLQHSKVECQDIEQTYRENLRWANEAAGHLRRTGKEPVTCPNDSAFLFYKMAIDEPKDFMGRMGQIESKGDAESAEKKNVRLSGAKAIAEIDGYLTELEAEEEERENGKTQEQNQDHQDAPEIKEGVEVT